VGRWRRAQALARTVERRPDLIEARGGLTDDDRKLLAELAELTDQPAGPASDRS
jgi:tRNA (guanine37-N1)-methyltransferase